MNLPSVWYTSKLRSCSDYNQNNEWYRKVKIRNVEVQYDMISYFLSPADQYEMDDLIK